jgi:hypothetical protein
MNPPPVDAKRILFNAASDCKRPHDEPPQPR